MVVRVGSMTTLATTVALLANASGVTAKRCYYDRYGRYRCTSGLATAARIGIAVGMAVLGLLILGCLFCFIMMRRRKARKNMVALPPPATATGGGPAHYEKPAEHQQGAYQPYPGGGTEYNNNQHGGMNYGSAEPQFPEPSYQRAGEYTPPSGPPPNAAYAPPAGPPPGK